MESDGAGGGAGVGRWSCVVAAGLGFAAVLLAAFFVLVAAATLFAVGVAVVLVSLVSLVFGLVLGMGSATVAGGLAGSDAGFGGSIDVLAGAALPALLLGAAGLWVDTSLPFCLFAAALPVALLATLVVVVVLGTSLVSLSLSCSLLLLLLLLPLLVLAVLTSSWGNCLRRASTPLSGVLVMFMWKRESTRCRTKALRAGSKTRMQLPSLLVRAPLYWYRLPLSSKPRL